MDTKKNQEFDGTGKLYAPQEAAKLKDVARKESIDENLGQGLLYSHPDTMAAAAQSSHSDNDKGSSAKVVVLEASKEVASTLTAIKETVLEKLAALPLPAEAVEAGRKSMENLIKEVTHTVQRTKHRLADSFSSISPNPTREASEVAENVDRNVLENAEGHVPESHHSKAYRDLSVSAGTAKQTAEQARIKSRL